MISMGPGGFRIMGASLSCCTCSSVFDWGGTAENVHALQRDRIASCSEPPVSGFSIDEEDDDEDLYEDEGDDEGYDEDYDEEDIDDEPVNIPAPVREPPVLHAQPQINTPGRGVPCERCRLRVGNACVAPAQLDYVGTFCMYQDEIVRGF